jgi:hypothetical protein
MPANQVTIDSLHGDLAYLARAEMLMSRTPIAPFTITPDQDSLSQQSSDVYAAMMRLSSVDAATASQSDVDDADAKTKIATAMFDAINNTLSVSFDAADVYAAVDDAVHRANAI